MASTPLSTLYSQSSFKNTICLFDWWLIKTQTQFHAKNCLGVAGITSTQKQALRVFSSAAITKRYDVFTIETSDDVTIVLKSVINGDKTLQNGFPSEVLKAFLFGFPVDWEQHAEKYCGVDSTTETLKAKTHIPHEHVDEIEFRKGQSREVLEDIVTDYSNASNLNSNAAEETTRGDVASVGASRFSVVIKNLEVGQKKFVSSCSLNNEENVSTMPSLEETPKKKKHVSLSHEDREAIEVPKDVTQEVSENITTDPSNGSNLKRNTSGETKGSKTGSRNFTRHSARLKNLFISKVKTNITPTSPVVIVTKEDEKPNSSSAFTARSGRKMEASGGENASSLSRDELQEQVTPNVAEHASNSKKRYKSREAKTKVVQEVDAENENLTEKKAKRKISITDDKKKSSARKKIIFKKVTVEEQGAPESKEENEAKHIVSPESLSVGRSRSGRLLLPVLEFWRNQLPVYDMYGQVTGIQESSPIQEQARGSGSKPRKKRKQ